jgi:hypothetical protein
MVYGGMWSSEFYGVALDATMLDDWMIAEWEWFSEQ